MSQTDKRPSKKKVKVQLSPELNRVYCCCVGIWRLGHVIHGSLHIVALILSPYPSNIFIPLSPMYTLVILHTPFTHAYPSNTAYIPLLPMHTLVILHTPFTHVYPSNILREEVLFSLACLLALTRSFARLVSRGLPTMRLTIHANDFVNAKSHAREKPLLAE